MVYVDPSRVDAMYEPFPAFRDWLGTASYSFLDLRRRADDLRSKAGSDVADRATELLLRAAAFDTGALEELYKTTRGLTLSVAAQAAAWQTRIESAGTHVRELFDAQLSAYRLAFDAAVENVPISEAFIRRIHEVACAPQDTYKVATPQGIQEQSLPKGVYKSHANHVALADNRFFAYAPVSRTSEEMGRLLSELRAEEFQQSDALLQAAYAHYALVRVHPFADGNGRVARVLASLFTCRGYSSPLVIFFDQRDEYLAGLRRADAGDSAPYVAFLKDCLAGTLRVSLDLVAFGTGNPPETIVGEIANLYGGRGGWPLNEVDGAAYAVVEIAFEEAKRQVEDLKLPAAITSSVDCQKLDYSGRSSHRQPLSEGGRMIRVIVKSGPPADGLVVSSLRVWVRRGDEPDRDILLDGSMRSHEVAPLPVLEINVDEVLPSVRSATRVRISAWVRAVLAKTLNELNRVATVSRSNRGY